MAAAVAPSSPRRSAPSRPRPASSSSRPVVGEVQPHVFGNFVEHSAMRLRRVFEEAAHSRTRGRLPRDVRTRAGLGVRSCAGREDFASGYSGRTASGPRPAAGAADHAWGRDREQPASDGRVPALLRAAGCEPYLDQRRARLRRRGPAVSSTRKRAADTYWARQRRTTAATSRGRQVLGPGNEDRRARGSSDTRTPRTTRRSRSSPSHAPCRRVHQADRSGSFELRGRARTGWRNRRARAAQERDRLHLAQPTSATDEHLEQFLPSPGTSTIASRS